jgi:vitamin B12/bleomycin/antimicrobial peptide transport system ATP-binding/permease protein
LKDICFLPQQPYLPPGTLRQVLEDGEHGSAISDDRIFTLLRELNLEQVVTQAGGLDSERDWRTLLPLREQQLLAVIHIVLAAPQFVFLDRVGTVLSSDEVQKLLRLLSNSCMTAINFGAADEPHDVYDAILECSDDGGWAWTDSQPEKSSFML